MSLQDWINRKLLKPQQPAANGKLKSKAGSASLPFFLILNVAMDGVESLKFPPCPPPFQIYLIWLDKVSLTEYTMNTLNGTTKSQHFFC